MIFNICLFFISDYLAFWGKREVVSNPIFHFIFNPELLKVFLWHVHIFFVLFKRGNISQSFCKSLLYTHHRQASVLNLQHQDPKRKKHRPCPWCPHGLGETNMEPTNIDNDVLQRENFTKSRGMPDGVIRTERWGLGQDNVFTGHSRTAVFWVEQYEKRQSSFSTL